MSSLFDARLAWNIFRGENFIKNTLIIIIAIGFIQSIFVFLQIIAQKSIGLSWLKESIISTDIDGVAEIVLNGKVWLRAYGLLPHPNVLGGLLVFSIIATLVYAKVFYFSEIVPRGTISGENENKIVPPASTRECLLSSTRGGRGTINSTGAEQFTINRQQAFGYLGLFGVKILIMFIFIIAFFVFIKPDFYSFVGRSIEDRVSFINVSRGTFIDNPWLGIGSGQYVLNLPDLDDNLKWQFQPVHNTFFLILNEYGIFVLLAFLVFLYKVFYFFENVPSRRKCSIPKKMFHLSRLANIFALRREAGVEHFTGQAWNNYKHNNRIYWEGMFLALMFIMLWDHYLWDIQQGQIILWLILGFLTANRKKTIIDKI